jgi:CheY-like chemotaxis protein
MRLRPNSSTAASSGVIVAHLTPTPWRLIASAASTVTWSSVASAVLDPEVVVLQLDVEVGEDQLVLDELPDDPGHLVAVELDDGFFTLIFAMRVLVVGAGRGATRPPVRCASTLPGSTTGEPCSPDPTAAPAHRRRRGPESAPLLARILGRRLRGRRVPGDPASRPARLTSADLVVLDLQLPGVDGFALLERVVRSHVPVLVLTADDTPTTRRRALGLGARDFVTKPLDRVEVLLRVGNLLQTRRLQRRSRTATRTSSAGCAPRPPTSRTRGARRSSAWPMAAEYRDDDTQQHTKRVGAPPRCWPSSSGCRPTPSSTCATPRRCTTSARSASPTPCGSSPGA